RIIFIGFLFIFEIILYLLLKKNEVGTLVAFFILGFFSIVINSFSSYYIYSGVNALDNINKKQETEEIKSSLVVLKDSKYESIEDIRDELVETALKQDEKNINDYKKNIESRKDIDLNLKDGITYINCAHDLI